MSLKDSLCNEAVMFFGEIGVDLNGKQTVADLDNETLARYLNDAVGYPATDVENMRFRRDDSSVLVVHDFFKWALLLTDEAVDMGDAEEVDYQEVVEKYFS